MKSYKGGFDPDTNDQYAAHEQGEKLRKTAEAMIVAAKGDLEAAKNLTSEKIKEALEEKKKMEDKIKEIMNDEELKAKISENVDKLSDTLNDISKKAKETAEKSLEEAKAQAEKLNKLRTDAGLTGDAAKAALEQGLNKASEQSAEAAEYATEKAKETYGKVFNKENEDKLMDAANKGKEEISKRMDAASKGAKQAYGIASNLGRGLFDMTRKRVDVKGDVKKGGKRKNKTKKLTKKEKKMKKARK